MLLAKSKRPYQRDPGLISQNCWTSLIYRKSEEENASESWFGCIDWMSIQQCHSMAKGLLNWRNILVLELYTAISRKVVGKKVHATISKGNMGYDQYTGPDDCSCRTYFCCFSLALANTLSWPFMPILSNFSEEQWTQNYPQCLSGLSRPLFPTTFLKIAVDRPQGTRPQGTRLLWIKNMSARHVFDP